MRVEKYFLKVPTHFAISLYIYIEITNYELPPGMNN